MSKLVVINGRARKLPWLAKCRKCLRAPSVLTSYRNSDGSPLDPRGGGPFLIKCDHGGEEMPKYSEWRDVSVPGVWAIQVSSGPHFYRSWYFGRAVRGWNTMHRWKPLETDPPGNAPNDNSRLDGATSAGLKSQQSR